MLEPMPATPKLRGRLSFFAYAMNSAVVFAGMSLRTKSAKG